MQSKWLQSTMVENSVLIPVLILLAKARDIDFVFEDNEARRLEIDMNYGGVPDNYFAFVKRYMIVTMVMVLVGLISVALVIKKPDYRTPVPFVLAVI